MKRFPGMWNTTIEREAARTQKTGAGLMLEPMRQSVSLWDILLVSPLLEHCTSSPVCNLYVYRPSTTDLHLWWSLARLVGTKGSFLSGSRWLVFVCEWQYGCGGEQIQFGAPKFCSSYDASPLKLAISGFGIFSTKSLPHPWSANDYLNNSSIAFEEDTKW
jgi:hypothetical protein